MDILTVETLAETLQELNRPLLTQGLRTLGQDRCAAILADTLTDEASGGMLTRDGTRRRTPPGVFFQRVRERATPQERRRLFPHLARKRNRFLCSYSVTERGSCQLGHSKEGTPWDTSHKPHG